MSKFRPQNPNGWTPIGQTEYTGKHSPHPGKCLSVISRNRFLVGQVTAKVIVFLIFSNAWPGSRKIFGKIFFDGMTQNRPESPEKTNASKTHDPDSKKKSSVEIHTTLYI